MLELHVVTGNPGAGKTTFVERKAISGDVVLDFDRIAQAAGSHKKRGHDPQYLAAARVMWGAIGRSLGSMQGRVWVIHGYPGTEALGRYRKLGARFHNLSGGAPAKAFEGQKRSATALLAASAPASAPRARTGTGLPELRPALKVIDPYKDKDGNSISTLKPSGSTRAWRKIRLEVLEAANWKCHYCGARAQTVDHIVPRVKGGSDKLSNLRAACWICNLSRGGRGSEGKRGS